MARYLKQVIVLRKDLCMPTGKVAAMTAHAAMTFLLDVLYPQTMDSNGPEVRLVGDFTPDQHRWLTELDPGIESTKQRSMAKIVCQVADEYELLGVELNAKASGLTCHRVIDSGHSHNKPGTFVGIAIGPHWPEQLEPVTGGLKLYR
jgi:PTH2 family peptidyl-tRNA hydrolase